MHASLSSLLWEYGGADDTVEGRASHQAISGEGNW